MNPSSPTSAPATEREALQLVALGLNAWVVAVLVPAIHAGSLGLVGTLVASLPLVVLAAGVMQLRADPGRARWALLFGVPAALGAVLAWNGQLATRDAYGTIGLALAAASLLAFTGAAARAVSRDRVGKRAESQPLAGKEPVAEPRARRIVRRLLLATTALFTFAMTVLAPTLAGRRERVRIWGDGADDATVLSAVVATLIAALALGTVIGPALRASRTRRDHPTRARRRIAAAMLIATCAGVGFLLLRHLDP